MGNISIVSALKSGRSKKSIMINAHAPLFRKYLSRGASVLSKFKIFIFFLPILAICLIVINLYHEEKVAIDEDLSRENPSANQNIIKRSIASINISTELTTALGKINNQQTSKVTNQIASEDLSYLKAEYFPDKNVVGQTAFQNNNQEVHERVSQNKELYNEILDQKIQDALLANDDKAIIQLFYLAASLPLGQSKIHNLSENILIDMASKDKEWDEDLFRSALQFYYIQNVIKNDKNSSLGAHFTDKCQDENLKIKILAIDKELNIYSKNEEDLK